MIRTGVIGYGLGGMAFHAPLIEAVPELELAAIATSRADAVRERYPAAQVTDAAALIADPNIRLVAISTPNDSHFPLAKAALEAGKHVVIDKPFTNSVAEGEALAALADARGLILAAFHNRRWDGDFLTVRKLIASDRIGEVTLAELRWDRYRPEVTTAWRDTPGVGAGMLADLGPHLIDQALVLFGAPEAVSADIAVQRAGARTDDYFELTLHYGVRRVLLSASRLIASPRPRFALHGRLGGFVKYGLDPQEPMMKAGGSANDPGFGVEDPANHGTLVLADGTRETVMSERGDYRLFYSGMAQAITEGGAPPVSAGDAILGLRLMELARRSSDEGRRIAL
ncbi:oxidoreductase [Sphingomonas sp. M1-B02]|uniref:oxidoreductase n=1 Tax=Sphingomonas sp. M1-B02 TaxID=3114300 RepID=UPI00223F7132|nr:oxidoreductase [Sphingomonas sp. S6-11]UZK66598.1 oxidoreductase [Sphingomonas sp. S6-11]